jgi:deoxyadenosine/deoxycytidine kinase
MEYPNISIEANIGVGKTTFLSLIDKFYHDEFNTISEPLEDWLNKFADVDNNILGLLYNDSKRWGYTFQHNAFLTRIQKIENNFDSNKINLSERSVLSDYNVFAKMLKADGKLNEIEWKIYINWMNLLLKKISIKPKLIVYLRLDPEIAYQRIKKRNRHEEESIPLEYIKQVHEFHEKWILEQTEIPVIVLDASKDFENDREILYEYISQIKETWKKIV